ncbi:MAG: hypothetical protein KJ726_03445 [Verrucomicrobia bacterium]|nr:hypothetical protein [Verrucomicrobiota bacterium]MBU1909080.1 hypothetical protein [Verrucomicrobiota bacterium]
MKKRWMLAGAVFVMVAVSVLAEEAPMETPAGWRLVVSPLVGADRNEMDVRRGEWRSLETDTGPEYGLFVMALHPNVVINNFLFYANVNDCDVWGDLLFVNYYANAKAALTWNAGAGYLYHEIKPKGSKITVKVPMVKAGPVFRLKALHLSLNPYLGYGWERVETPGGEQDNDSFLYGLTVGWRWRMLEAGINYYYQDSQGLKPDEDFNVLRARLIGMISRQWGLGARVDVMEHSTSKDLSFLAGPVFMF